MLKYLYTKLVKQAFLRQKSAFQHHRTRFYFHKFFGFFYHFLIVAAKQAALFIILIKTMGK